VLAVARELPFGPQALRLLPGEAGHEGEALAGDERVGDGLVMELLEGRLEVEQFELAGPAGHEQVNDALGPRFEVRLRPGGGSLQASLVEEGGEAHRADTEGAVAEEMTAGPEQEGIDHASSLKGNASG